MNKKWIVKKVTLLSFRVSLDGLLHWIELAKIKISLVKFSS